MILILGKELQGKGNKINLIYRRLMALMIMRMIINNNT